tara:strand:- start:1427 stop:2224 length:798 start_codon:yes stop_codon:yes gene_type:complete
MILIGIPVYGGQGYADFFMSVMNLVKVFDSKNIRYEIKLIQHESLITRARNGLVAMFMSNPNFSKLLFLDCDIAFSPDTIISMLDQQKPIVGAAYPKKMINWNKVKHFANKVKSQTELQFRATDMNYNFKYYDTNKVKIENDFVEVLDIPTGCMLIDKRAMSIIINKNRDTQYTNNCAGYGSSACFYDLFKTGVVEIKGVPTYLSEDYYFCHLAREAGIALWLSTKASLIHIGRCDYMGNLGMILADPSGERLDKDNQLILGLST